MYIQQEIWSVELGVCPMQIFYPPFARRAMGEVFVLLYVCLFVRSTISHNPRAEQTNKHTEIGRAHV